MWPCRSSCLAQDENYLINGFVAGKPQNRSKDTGRKVVIWLSFETFA